MSNNNYETLANAKIGPNVDISFPSNFTPDEVITMNVNAAATGTTDAITKMLQTSKGMSAATSLKFVNGAGVVMGIIDVVTNWDDKGLPKAIFSATLATGASIVVGAALAPVATGATTVAIAAIIGGVVGGLVSKGADWVWDRSAETIDILSSKDGRELLLSTNMSDIKNIIPFARALSGIKNDDNIYFDTFKIEQKVGDETITYEIKSGDTIWDICNKLGMSYEELIELNPWLKDRFSDDMKFALIRPGEKLKVPKGLAIGKPGFDVPFDIADGAGTPGVDPILVDLDGDGVISTTSVNNGRYFDHSKDGFSELSSWVSGNDGMLVIDKNNDGVINDGGEVFGDNYVKGSGSLASSGFDALSDLDSNGDGIISSLDDSFGLIKILKGDGSLISLEEAGIVSISLNNTSAGDDGNGIIDENRNTLVSLGSFVRGDGSIGSLGDFNLVVDKMDSVEVNKGGELKVA